MACSRRLLALFLIGLSALGCQTNPIPARKVHGTATHDDPSFRLPHSIVVDLKDGITQEQLEALDKELRVPLRFNSIEGAVDGITAATDIDDVDSVLARIRGMEVVEAAEPLAIYQALFTPNDPDFDKQWNLKLIDVQKAWDVSRGKGAVVAVLDTGIAYEDYGDFRQVPDLKGIRFVPGYDFIHHSEHPNDDHGHGTHVAGTIAQATDNSIGVAGIAFEASLMPLKVLDQFGRGNAADIADAIRFAADHGANVINMSLGGGAYSRVLELAVAYARKKGVTVVCAAGNTGAAQVQYPAAYEGAVGVGAIGPRGTRAPYSSFGRELDLAAPGGDKSLGETYGILQNTIDPEDPRRSIYAYYQGTSMAAPHVAAVAALLYAAGARHPDQVERALYNGASPVSGQDWTDQYGHGVLNAYRALEVFRSDRASDWRPLVWALALLVPLLLTLSRRGRPGYFDLLLSPKFAIPLLLATVGLVFLRSWISSRSSGSVSALWFPIPDWQRIVFGRHLANPLFYSVLIPFGISILAIRWQKLRPIVAGLALGFAGFLSYAAWAKSPPLAYLPFSFIAVPWLVLNALLCLIVARAMLRSQRT